MNSLELLYKKKNAKNKIFFFSKISSTAKRKTIKIYKKGGYKVC